MTNINDLFTTSDEIQQLNNNAGVVRYHRRSSPASSVVWWDIPDGYNLLAEELKDIVDRVRKKYPDIKVATAPSYQQPHRRCALYFVGDRQVFAWLTPYDTRRSNKPGYQLHLLYEYKPRNSNVQNSTLSTFEVKSVDTKKLAKLICSLAVRVPNILTDLGEIAYGRDAPARGLNEYIRNKDRVLRTVSVSELIPTIRWLHEQGIVIPDSTLRERFSNILEATNELERVKNTHDRMVAIRDLGNGNVLVAGVVDVVAGGRVQNSAVIPADEVPVSMQMRVATLSMCAENTSVENVGHRYDEKTYFVVCGDFDE